MMSEDKFLSSLFPKLGTNERLIVPPGDDCAVYSVPGSELLQVVAVDQVIEERHYLKETPAFLVGRKLLCRNLSDIAAMGATPRYCLLAVASCPDQEWLKEFHRGVFTTAREFNTILIGGDLAVQSGPAVCSLTIIGETTKENLVLRQGAKEGDVLLATGSFGNSFKSEHHLHFQPRIQEGLWLAQQAGIHAMMDITDGLIKDSLRLADKAGLALHYQTSTIPLREGADLQMALNEGEDYELIIAVKQEEVENILNDWPFPNTPLTKIAFFRGESKVEAYDEYGVALSASAPGYDHFNAE